MPIMARRDRLEAITGIKPDELLEEISTAYRALLEAQRQSKLLKQLKEIKLASLMEAYKQENTKDGRPPSQAACKTFALASPEYTKKVYEHDEAEGRVILLKVEHEKLKNQLTKLYEEAKLARQELYTLKQKQ